MRWLAANRWRMLLVGFAGLILLAIPAFNDKLWPLAVFGGWFLGAFHMWDAISSSKTQP